MDILWICPRESMQIENLPSSAFWHVKILFCIWIWILRFKSGIPNKINTALDSLQEF